MPQPLNFLVFWEDGIGRPFLLRQEEVPIPIHLGPNSRMLGPKVERKKSVATLSCPQGLHLCIGFDCKSHGFPKAKSEPGMSGKEGGQLMVFSTKVTKERKGSF